MTLIQKWGLVRRHRFTTQNRPLIIFGVTLTQGKGVKEMQWKCIKRSFLFYVLDTLVFCSAQKNPNLVPLNTETVTESVLLLLLCSDFKLRGVKNRFRPIKREFQVLHYQLIVCQSSPDRLSRSIINPHRRGFSCDFFVYFCLFWMWNVRLRGSPLHSCTASLVTVAAPCLPLLWSGRRRWGGVCVSKSNMFQ